MGVNVDGALGDQQVRQINQPTTAGSYLRWPTAAGGNAGYPRRFAAEGAFPPNRGPVLEAAKQAHRMGGQLASSADSTAASISLYAGSGIIPVHLGVPIWKQL